MRDLHPLHHSERVLRELRFDRSTLQAPRVQGDGTIIYDAVLSRAGVFKYLNTDGSWRNEYRPASEVFNPASMATFDGMAVTDYHPNGIPVDVENRTALGRGYIVPGSLRRDGMELIGSIHITDANLIAAVKNGRTAVSLGYFQDRIPENGVSTEDGLPYTYRQSNMRGNHAAIVDTARAGDRARLQVDSITFDYGDNVMDELKKALADLLTANTLIAQQKMRLDHLETEHTSTKKSLSTVEAARDSLQDKLDKSEKLRTDGESKAMATARAHVLLETVANRVLTVDGVAPKLDGQTARQIREACIVKLSGKPVPSGKDDSYIEARFDTLIEDSIERGSNDNANARAVLSVISADRKPVTETIVTLDNVLNEDGSYDEGKVATLTAKQMQKLNADRDSNAWRTKSK